jgi:hypothetical protein
MEFSGVRFDAQGENIYFNGRALMKLTRQRNPRVTNTFAWRPDPQFAQAANPMPVRQTLRRYAWVTGSATAPYSGSAVSRQLRSTATPNGISTMESPSAVV